MSDQRVRASCLCLLALLEACGGGFTGSGGTDARPPGEAASVPSEAGLCGGCGTADCDADGLPNPEELLLGTDPCSADSDGDKIPDGVEVKAGKICVAVPEQDTPRPLQTCEKDSDCAKGKCVGYDPKNKDQDGDGVADGDEDRDHDGQLGSCRALCPTGKECGEGQSCSAGKCLPPLDPKCAGTESDPRLKDTDGDGVPDAQEGANLVCNTAALITPGLDQSKSGDWTLALDPAFGTARKATLMNAGAVEAAVAFDDPGALVAGFAIAKAGDADPLKQDEADESKLATLSDLAVTAVFNRKPFSTYDKFPAATSQRLITAATARTPGELRDALLTALSGHPAAEVTLPAGPAFGAGTTSFSLLLTTVARSDRVVLVGAVAPSSAFSDSAKATSIRMRDLTNGTGLARTGKGLKAECDGFSVTGLPIADIVWLIDTSGSMSDDQALIASAATEFFTRLKASSIDFRVGVMRAGSSTSGVSLTGGMYTKDQAVFSTQVKAPTGPTGDENEAPVTAGKNLHAVLKKNPPVTAPGDLGQGLRPGAKLIYVFVTDEEERPLQVGDIDSQSKTQAQLEAHPSFAPLLSYYKQEGLLAFGMIALPPDCSKKAEPSWVAKAMVEKTGGASWPICKTDAAVLSAALTALISAAQGASSTFKLSRVPISSTLKLALGGTLVPRSAADGFDYDGPNNAIIFNVAPGSSYAPKIGDTIAVSYRFFEDAPHLE